METVWFVIVALATAAYAATDGFDLGLGILFPLLGRNDAERSAVRATISHLWRAYEVWLIVLVLFFSWRFRDSMRSASVASIWRSWSCCGA